jgi:tryptophan-rich sensory protein
MEKLAMIDKMGDVPYTFTNVGRNKKMIYRLIIFMALNFAALAIGGLFTSKSGLTALIGFFLFFYWPELKLKSALILPYFIWLIIATSLNGYILLKN